MESTPVSILERVRTLRDEGSWNELIEICTPLFCKWARVAGVPREVIADLVQEVLLVLVRQLSEFVYDRNRSFRAWLKTITLNKWRDELRKKIPDSLGDENLVADPAVSKMTIDQPSL